MSSGPVYEKAILVRGNGTVAAYGKAVVVSVGDEGGMKVEFVHMKARDIAMAACGLVAAADRLGLLPEAERLMAHPWLGAVEVAKPD